MINLKHLPIKSTVVEVSASLAATTEPGETIQAFFT
jgi:hypothetical protein